MNRGIHFGEEKLELVFVRWGEEGEDHAWGSVNHFGITKIGGLAVGSLC